MTRITYGLRLLAVLAAAITGIIPFTTYIYSQNNVLLIPIILANAAAYLMVAMTTIQAVLKVDDRKRKAIPDFAGHQPMMRRWYAAIRATWKWQLLAIIIRVGLIVAVVQFIDLSTNAVFGSMNLSDGRSVHMGVFAPFTNRTWSFQEEMLHKATTSTGIIISPALMALTAGLLVLYALAETALLAALGLVAEQFSRRSHYATLVLSLILRVGLSMMILFVLSKTVAPYSRVSIFYTRDDFNGRRIFATLYHGAFAPADTGVMTLANIPVTNPGYVLDYSLVRCIVSAVLGLVFYAVLTGGMLYAAVAVQRRRNTDVS